MHEAATTNDAEALALAALAATLTDERRARAVPCPDRTDPPELRLRAAASRALLAALLHFLEAHEPDLVAVAEAIGVKPEALVAARAELEAMSRPLLITDCDEVLLHMVAHFDDWLGEAHGIHFDLRNRPFRRGDDRSPRPAKPVADDHVWPLLDALLPRRDAPPDPGPRRARGARPDRRGRRHRHPHQPRRRGASAGGSSSSRATASATKSSATRAARACRRGRSSSATARRPPCSSTICRCITPRSPSMRRRSSGCTWSPSRGWRRAVPTRRACPCADRRLADRDRMDPRASSRRSMTKTIFITGATAGIGAGRGAALRSRRLAGDRHRPPPRPAARAWPRSLAMPSCR